MASTEDFASQRLRNVKSEIRAVLISHPSKSIDINTFLKEYYSIVGERLPYQDLGFKTPSQFLNTIPDVVKLTTCSLGIPSLSAVVNEKSCHISDLVKNQKKNAPRRRSTRSQFMPPRFFPHHWEPLPYSPALHSPNFSGLFPPMNGFPIPMPKIQGFHRNGPMYKNRGETYKVAPPSVKKPNSPCPRVFQQPKSPCPRVFQQPKSPCPRVFQQPKSPCPRAFQQPKSPLKPKQTDSVPTVASVVKKIEENSPKTKDTHQQEVNKGDHYVQLEPASVLDNLQPPVVKRLTNEEKEDIRKLFARYPNGLPATQLLIYMKSLLGKTLDFRSHGYKSLDQLILDNSDVIFVEELGRDDWYLYDARLKPKKHLGQGTNSKYIPDRVADNLATLVKKRPEGIETNQVLEIYKEEFGTEIDIYLLGFDSIYAFLHQCKSIDVKTFGAKEYVFPREWADRPQFGRSQENDVSIPALPPLVKLKYIWREHFKDNECNPSFKLKPPLIPEGPVFCLQLSDIQSPALLWIHTTDDLAVLNTLMAQLNQFYLDHQDDYMIEESWVVPGLYVAAQFQDTWHRAEVTSIYESYTTVCFVDYGTESTVLTETLRKLDVRFAKERILTIRSSLYNLKPFKGDSWPLESSKFLYGSYADLVIEGELKNVNYLEPSIDLILHLVEETEKVCINELLVANKLARWSVDPELILDEKNVATFYKFLPSWMTTSKTRTNDIKLSEEHLRFCTHSRFEALNLENLPCCKLHCVQSFFKANPQEFGRVWRDILYNSNDHLIDEVIEHLRDQLVDFGWDKILTQTVSCVHSTASPNTDNIEVPAKAASLEPSPSAVDTQTKVSSLNVVEDKCPLKEDCKLTNATEHLQLSLKKSDFLCKLTRDFLSATTVGIYSKPETKDNELSGCMTNRFPGPSGQFNCNIVLNCKKRYFKAWIGESQFTLILFGGLFRICLSELLRQVLPSLPSTIKQLLAEASEDIKVIKVTEQYSAKLYSRLKNLSLTKTHEVIILLSFTDAHKIIKIVNPYYKYESILKKLDLYLQANCKQFRPLTR